MNLSAQFLSTRINRLLGPLFEAELHKKTLLSLHHGVLGTLHAAHASVAAIGEGLSAARGVKRKHAIKQTDRLLSNLHVDTETMAGPWLRFVVGERKDIVVALDWTEFPKDDHSTLCLSVLNSSGRATPVLWKTAEKSALHLQRNAMEDTLLERLCAALPEGVHVTVLCDRGFGDQALYQFLQALGMDYIIRFREAILCTDAQGRTLPARDFVPKNGRAKALVGARVTGEKTPVAQVVVKWAKNAQQAWCLATSRSDLSAAEVTNLYGRRFCIEERFRDTKDFRFGMGMSTAHVSDPARRDRLLWLCALSQMLLHVLGAAGESLGLLRWMQVNTRKKREHSFFSQGLYYYECLTTWPADQVAALLTRFDELLRQHPLTQQLFALL